MLLNYVLFGKGINYHHRSQYRVFFETWCKRKRLDVPVCVSLDLSTILCIVREPVVGLILWLRPKGLDMCSYEEMYAELKNQTLIKNAGTQTSYMQSNTPGVTRITNSFKMGVPYTPASNLTMHIQENF